MKNILVKIGLWTVALAAVLCLCACEREAHNSYAFSLGPNSKVTAEVPLDSVRLGTGFTELNNYMLQLDMFEYEDYDNDARTIEEAMEKNDAEAVAVFNARVRSFNPNVLQDIYKRAGYLSVNVDVTYVMIREDGKRVAEHDFKFDFADLN